MIVVMITLCRRVVPMVAAVFIAGTAAALAERSNPYLGIVDRNPFALRPPPPPVTETNAPPQAPAAKVILTGVTSMFGPRSKRAFLEISETPEAGKQAVTRRPVLAEGDRDGDIEVVSIDIDRNVVTIRNRSVAAELTFEAPKAGPAASSGALANVPVANPQTAAPGQPTIISANESRGGITMYGGGGGFAGNSSGINAYGGSSAMASGHADGISSYGGVSAAPVAPALAGGSGLAAIPSRAIRTPQQPAPEIDREKQMLLMEANRVHNEQINQGVGRGGVTVGNRPAPKFPPLPPTALSEHLGGGGPPVPVPR